MYTSSHIYIIGIILVYIDSAVELVYIYILVKRVEIYASPGRSKVAF